MYKRENATGNETVSEEISGTVTNGRFLPDAKHDHLFFKPTTPKPCVAATELCCN